MKKNPGEKNRYCIEKTQDSREDVPCKLKVKQPDDWLKTIEDNQAGGCQPALQMSVASDYEYEGPCKALVHNSSTACQSSNSEENSAINALVRDSVVNLLYSHFDNSSLQTDDYDVSDNEAGESNGTKRVVFTELASKDSVIQGLQNRDKSKVFHQKGEPTSHTHNQLLTSSSEDDSSQAILKPNFDLNKCRHKLAENATYCDLYDGKCVANAQFASYGTRKPYPVESAQNSNHTVMAFHEQNDTGSPLRKASAIMDLLEIYPRPQRTGSQDKKMGLWIRKVREELHSKREGLENDEINKDKTQKNEHLSRSTVKFTKNRVISSSVHLRRKFRVPKQLSNTVGNHFADFSLGGNLPKQKLLVYMNANRNFFKDPCKRGCDHLSKTPQFFRGAHYGLSVTKYSAGTSRIRTAPINYKIHNHLQPGGWHRHHHHHLEGYRHTSNESSDEFVRHNAITGSEEKGSAEEPHKEYLVVGKRRSAQNLDVLPSNGSTAHKKTHIPQNVAAAHSDGKGRKPSFTDDYDEPLPGRNYHSESRNGSGRGKKVQLLRSKSKPFKAGIKVKNINPYPSRRKKENLKVTSSKVNLISSDLSVTSTKPDSFAVLKNSKYPRHSSLRKLTFPRNLPPSDHYNPSKKAPSIPLNFRQRLISTNSKASANYDKINVKDFIDFLSTLSRNTIGTLTNKKKALRLYRNYLTNSRHK